MALTATVVHPFVCTIPDDVQSFADGEVTPSRYNLSHTVTFSGLVDLTQLDESIAPTWTGAHAWSKNGALSLPSLWATGTWVTGGSTTTNKPHILIEPAGATSNLWSTSGTGLGVNAASGFTGNLFDFQTNGVARATLSATGTLTVGSLSTGALTLTGAGNIQVPATAQIYWNGRAIMESPADSQWRIGNNAGTQQSILTIPVSATWQFGAANAASPVAQTLQGQGSRAGTDTNVGGASVTIQPGTGTGTGTISELVLKAPVAVASGSGAQTQTTGLIVRNGTAKLTSYAVSGVPSAATSGAGAMIYVSDESGGAVPAFSDGTDWRRVTDRTVIS